MSTDFRLIEAAVEGPLAAVADEVRAATLASWRLRRTDAPTRSRLGGVLDLPPGTRWPTRKDRPLAFLAQILVEETPEARPLPPGLLSFFYDADAIRQPWGFDPADRDGHRILHAGPDVDLAPANLPGVEPAAMYVPGGVTFARELTLPEHDTPAGPSLPAELRDAYFDLLEALAEHRADRAPLHRLLGHPDQVQGDMQTECQLVSNGLYCGDASGYDDPRAHKLREGAGAWRLVLQLDSEFVPREVTWGDGGRLFFWLRADDLATARFDRSWAILQTS